MCFKIFSYTRVCFTVTSMEGETVLLVNNIRVYPKRRRDLLEGMYFKILTYARVCFTITSVEGERVWLLNDNRVFAKLRPDF